MDERTERRILEKAKYVGEAVTVLASKRDALSFEDYTNRREDRDVVEREFQTAIEACIDIGQLIVRETNGAVPETNAEVFRALERMSLLDEPIADRMAQAAGFRNVLAHQYGTDVNDRDVYNFLQTELPIFRAYLERVRDAIE